MTRSAQEKKQQMEERLEKSTVRRQQQLEQRVQAADTTARRVEAAKEKRKQFETEAEQKWVAGEVGRV